MNTKTILPRSAQDRARAFHGHFKPARSDPEVFLWRTVPKRWAFDFPVPSCRHSTVKAMATQRWTWSAQSRDPGSGYGDAQGIFLVGSLEGQRKVTPAFMRVFEEADQRYGRSPSKPGPAHSSPVRLLMEITGHSRSSLCLGSFWLLFIS